MIRYILKRLLLFIPTIIAISLLAFVISVNAPGDPVERLLNVADSEGGIGQNSAVAEKMKQQKRHELGLELPLFYVGLATLADVDTLYKIPEKTHRETIQRLLYKTGNKRKVIAYYTSLRNAVSTYETQLPRLSYIVTPENASNDEFIKTGNILYELLETNKIDEISIKIDKLKLLISVHGLQNNIKDLVLKFADLENNKQSWKTAIPTIHFHGFNNQYHRWLSNVIQGDFGVSYRDQQPVMQRIKQRFWWSFTLTFLAVILAYAISIPIGVYSAYKRNSFFDRSTATVLFMLYSLPSFFVGTMLLLFFANPDFYNWFPESGVQDPATFNDQWNFFTKLKHWAPFLVLPFITYVYSSFAFISRQMRVGMLDVLQQDYIQTARAKGISESGVIWKHAFRNALLPIITVFASVLPLAISGSVVVETIFGIPGMGLEIYESIRNYDYPMIVAIFTIFGMLTLVGYLLADILYAWADPRISFSKK